MGRLRVTRKSVQYLDGAEVVEARRCTMRGGMMASELDHLRWLRRHPYDHNYVYRLRNLDTRELIGWALVWGCDDGASAYVYVRASHRRQGHGTRIIHRVLKDFPPPRLSVFPHNERSYRFFKEAGVIPMR